VNQTWSKNPSIRLDSESYRRLCQDVLRKDGFRCQSCGSMQNLQVHHQEFRSHSGDDSELNLITLCASCHRLVHERIRNDATTLHDYGSEHRLCGTSKKKPTT
jgi:5-methylcytosine-specific restriction endonuclease McrA